MVDKKSPRLREVAKEFNVGIGTIVEFLEKKGIHIENNPNTRVDENIYSILSKEYSSDINLKKESEKIQLHKPIPTKNEEARDKDENLEDADEVRITDFTSHADIYRSDVDEFKPKIKVVGKVDLEKKKDKQESKEEPVAPEDTKSPQTSDAEVKSEKPKLQGPKIVGKVDIEKKVPSAPKNENVESIETKTKEESKIVDQKENEQIDQNFIPSRYEKLSGPTVVGKIELPDESKKKIINAQPNDDSDKKKKKKKRKRIKKFEKDALAVEKPEVISPEKVERKDRYQKFGKESETERKRPELQPKRKIPFKQEVNEEDVTKQIKETLARLTNKTKSKTTKYKKEKREALSQRQRDDEATEKNVLKVAEFVSVNDLATMMNVPVTQVITTCMNMGLFVSINQRLDAETIALVADEFGYKVEFVAVEVVEAINDSDEDKEEDLVPRPPIVTVMGHVDHGKTSLLDWIRKTNVIAGEAGGITQHIGAYSVELSNDKVITFLDTPGHEAFTAMRARGAQVTDVAIIVIAADDHIMPQTIEAINHAQAAGVPIVFAINKIDKENANPNKVKEELANMNLMVEEWGGKYQSQDISAKKGTNVDLLLEKVLLEAEILNLKAN
ncbi:MAG TPA: translation initiation factor IF-2 N-terminal domain-containing protein, partial [Salinivirgaceae bacterium]|nr:translation initiation factor IF-2 N-terminal domain-containing protein [Salinivirgaceae bacterium]